MQNYILDFNFRESASILDNKRLFANIYENIHGLSSLLGCNRDLYTPKRSVANHPNIKRWSGYEPTYYAYIWIHIEEWIIRGYMIGNITRYNMQLLEKYKVLYQCYSEKCPDWVTKDLIKSHQYSLLQKNPDFYKDKFLEINLLKNKVSKIRKLI